MTISRRSLLRTGGSLVGAAALNTSIFGGAFAETPKKGGTLKVASGGSSTGDSLDPTTYAGNYPMTLGYMWGRPCSVSTVTWSLSPMRRKVTT